MDDDDIGDIDLDDEPEEALAGELANLDNISLSINVTHMRCAFHTLQLSVQDGLKQPEIKKSGGLSPSCGCRAPDSQVT